jgi:cytoskeletal protein CcmA (bactofilin family)
MNDKSQKQTLVEEGTEFVGTMRATCPIVVRGAIEGDVNAPAISVTSTGSVSGNVKAQRVDSHGVLAGSVEADEVSLAGEVRSDTVIRARSLEVKLAADKGRLEVTFGNCVLDVGDMPSDRPAKDDRDHAAPSASAGEAIAQSAATAATERITASADDEGDAKSKRGKKRRGESSSEDASETEPIVAATDPVGAEPSLPA